MRCSRYGGGIILKSIVIVGSGRNGKTTLAQKIHAELNHYVIHMDYLMTTLDRAYPQLDVRVAWDYDKVLVNISPFIGHFLGMSVRYRDFDEDLVLDKHVVKGNKFVMEVGHFNFDKISSIFQKYDIGELEDNFILIGLVQNKTAEEFLKDLRKYDTEDEWTYDCDDDELMDYCKLLVEHNQEMYDNFIKYGFTIYDTSGDREQVFKQIIDDIECAVVE